MRPGGDSFKQSNYTFDGTKYDIEVRFADDLDGWGDPDQLAVKMFYFFSWES